MMKHLSLLTIATGALALTLHVHQADAALTRLNQFAATEPGQWVTTIGGTMAATAALSFTNNQIVAYAYPKFYTEHTTYKDYIDNQQWLSKSTKEVLLNSDNYLRIGMFTAFMDTLKFGLPFGVLLAAIMRLGPYPKLAASCMAKPIALTLSGVLLAGLARGAYRYTASEPQERTVKACHKLFQTAYSGGLAAGVGLCVYGAYQRFGSGI